MEDLIDNSEMERVLEKLESLEDETLAVQYLAKFNEATKNLGTLIMNRDESLSHEQWEAKCSESKSELDELLVEIEKL